MPDEGHETRHVDENRPIHTVAWESGERTRAGRAKGPARHSPERGDAEHRRIGIPGERHDALDEASLDHEAEENRAGGQTMSHIRDRCRPGRSSQARYMPRPSFRRGEVDHAHHRRSG